MAPATAMVAQSRLTIRKAKREVAGGGLPCVARATASDSPPVKKAESAKTRQSLFP